jgi:hypothetical protein
LYTSAASPLVFALAFEAANAAAAGHSSAAGVNDLSVLDQVVSALTRVLAAQSPFERVGDACEILVIGLVTNGVTRGAVVVRVVLG